MTEPEDLDILLHTLGLSEKNRQPYRNHYVAGPGHHAMAKLERLIEQGLMYLAPRVDFLAKDDRVYLATAEGERVAIAENERRNPPLPRNKARYRKYLDYADANDITFTDFLKQRLYRDMP